LAVLALTGGGDVLRVAVGLLLGVLITATAWLLVVLSPVIAPILWLVERLHLERINLRRAFGLAAQHGHTASRSQPLTSPILGLARPISAPPGEFVDLVAGAFPAARGSITGLTHAYEDVRYGSLEVTEASAERLRRHQPALLATIREAPRADEPVDEGSPAGG